VHDFRTLARILEERGEIYRVSRPVDRKFEMPALMEQVEKQRRGFIFEQVRGAAFPVVGGLLNRIECYGWALGSTPGEPFGQRELDARIEAARARPLSPALVATGPCKEVVLRGEQIDLAQLPVPTYFAEDSGPFITAAIGISRNPSTGKLNVGIYRTLILGRDTMVVNASSLSDLQKFYRAAETSREPMPLALAIGADPALLIAASCKFPPEVSEVEIAGGLNGGAIPMVKCETSDLLVPARAEMIIEGTVDLSRRIENTLGEFAGQYGTETAPVSRVNAITHRRDALFYSILAGRNPEHNTLGAIATYGIQRNLSAELRRQFPGIVDINAFIDPRLGSMLHVVVSINKQSDAETGRLIRGMFAAAGGFFPVSHITKRIIVVDTDVNVHDLEDVEWALWSRVADAGKYIIIPDVPSWELERCAKEGRGSVRIGIDATMDIEDREKLKRPLIPDAAGVHLADYVKDVLPPLTR
jgi:2,5-furandicarboxylate decarboxylase 1